MEFQSKHPTPAQQKTTSVTEINQKIMPIKITAGICVSGQGKVNLIGNRCEENSDFGIMLFDSASIMVKNNICSRNKMAGIGVVGNQSKANLIDNCCEDNRDNNLMEMTIAEKN